jgi:hypothetical protein
VREIHWYVSWLRNLTRKYSILQFAYQRGRHDAKQEGIEIGRFQSSLRSVNFCPTHHVPTSRHWIDLADKSKLEVWTCPHWEDHSIFPIIHQQTGKLLAAYNQAKHDGAGSHTAVMAAMPRRRTTQPLTPQLERWPEKEVH